MATFAVRDFSYYFESLCVENFALENKSRSLSQKYWYQKNARSKKIVDIGLKSFGLIVSGLRRYFLAVNPSLSKTFDI